MSESLTLEQAMEAIEELQTKVSFQEHTIDTLNDAYLIKSFMY